MSVRNLMVLAIMLLAGCSDPTAPEVEPDQICEIVQPWDGQSPPDTACTSVATVPPPQP